MRTRQSTNSVPYLNEWNDALHIVRNTSLFAISLVALSGITSSAERPSLPAGFVRLNDIDPTIIVDMRYAGPQNFTGKTVPGYRSNTCILAKPVAHALKRVQRDLAQQNYSLKVYDCYRPTRAVSSFLKWARRRKDDVDTKFYFPRLTKRQIISQGYVAPRSTHSRGVAVDLTIVRLDGKETPEKTEKETKDGLKGACNLPPKQGLAKDEVEMGTVWDCFDRASHTYSKSVSAEARRNRAILVSAMRKQGFKNYAKEWWHFSLRLPQFSKRHNFPVE